MVIKGINIATIKLPAWSDWQLHGKTSKTSKTSAARSLSMQAVSGSLSVQLQGIPEGGCLINIRPDRQLLNITKFWTE